MFMLYIGLVLASLILLSDSYEYNVTEVIHLPNNSSSNETVSSIRFLLLGDWGKGGITGTYISVLDESTSMAMEAPKSYLRTMKGEQKPLYQIAVAKAMTDFAETSDPPASFVVALGDNFYDNGLPSSTSSLWNSLWKDVYLTDSSALSIPWYPVLGNHDYGGGETAVQAQLARAKEHVDDDIWRLDNKNYAKRFHFHLPRNQSRSDNMTQGELKEVEEETVSIGIVFVDTTTLSPSQCKKCQGDATSEMQLQRIQSQLEEIEQLLLSLTNPSPITTSTSTSTSTAESEGEQSEEQLDAVQWLFVMGHYPILSNGAHGDNEDLVRYLHPLLVQYQVHAYFAGHDHFAAHLQDTPTTSSTTSTSYTTSSTTSYTTSYTTSSTSSSLPVLQYFITGTGSMLDSAKYPTTLGEVVWYTDTQPGYSLVEVTGKDTVTISFLNTHNEVLYAYTLDHPPVSPPVTPPVIPPETVSPPPSSFPTSLPTNTTTTSSTSVEGEGGLDWTDTQRMKRMVVVMAGISAGGLVLFLLYLSFTTSHSSSTIGSIGSTSSIGMSGKVKQQQSGWWGGGGGGGKYMKLVDGGGGGIMMNPLTTSIPTTSSTTMDTTVGTTTTSATVMTSSSSSSALSLTALSSSEDTTTSTNRTRRGSSGQSSENSNSSSNSMAHATTGGTSGGGDSIYGYGDEQDVMDIAMDMEGGGGGGTSSISGGDSSSTSDISGGRNVNALLTAAATSLLSHLFLSSTNNRSTTTTTTSTSASTKHTTSTTGSYHFSQLMEHTTSTTAEEEGGEEGGVGEYGDMTLESILPVQSIGTGSYRGPYPSPIPTTTSTSATATPYPYPTSRQSSLTTATTPSIVLDPLPTTAATKEED